MVRKTPIATGSSSQCPCHLAPHPYPGNWRLPVLWPSVRSSTTSDLRNQGLCVCCSLAQSQHMSIFLRQTRRHPKLTTSCSWTISIYASSLKHSPSLEGSVRSVLTAHLPLLDLPCYFVCPPWVRCGAHTTTRFYPPCGCPGWCPGHQAWQPAPLPTEPSRLC